MLKVNKSKAASAICFERNPHAARFGSQIKGRERKLEIY